MRRQHVVFRCTRCGRKGTNHFRHEPGQNGGYAFCSSREACEKRQNGKRKQLVTA